MKTELGMPFINAVAYAMDAHSGQVRKGSNTPYISHPLAVAGLVIEFGGNEEQAIAGLLHDVIEDCEPIFAERMQEHFGARVYSLVVGMTDAVGGTDGKAPWRERKEAFIARLRDANPDLLLLKACDAIHNVRCTITDVRRDGLAALSKFRGGIDGTVWYYTAIANATKSTAAGALLEELVADLTIAVLALQASTEGQPC